MMNRIGIIGGTFNPIHIAHLIIAEQFTEQMELDFCYFVPANISPFKVENYPLVSAIDRIEMIKLAIKGNPKFKIETFETDKGEVSFSIDTIRYFIEKYSDSEIFYLVGDDQAASFTKWKNWYEIIEKVQICIARRKLNLKEKEINTIINILTYKNKKPVLLDAPIIDISSTFIRERILKNKSTRYFLPDKVEEYIKKKELYI